MRYAMYLRGQDVLGWNVHDIHSLTVHVRHASAPAISLSLSTHTHTHTHIALAICPGDMEAA